MKGKKTGGRKRGVPNKMTRDVREAFEEAIEYAQGKKGYSLKDWATRSDEDNAKFWQAAIKAMPKAVDITSAGNELSALTWSFGDRKVTF